MKTPQTLPFGPSEKRKVLRLARDAGVIPYDDLDRLLIEACTSPAKLHGLLRSLRGVRLVDAFEVDATGGWKPGAAETGIVGLAVGANPAVMILSSVGTSVASEKLSAGIEATAKHGADRVADVLEDEA